MPRELLFRLSKRDFRVDTFRSGGKGGQNQNKVESGVRIVHPDSGAVGESREERSQYQNRQTAFRRLVNSARFQTWLKVKAARCLQQRDLEAEVDASLQPQYLDVEMRHEGQWMPWDEERLLPHSRATTSAGTSLVPQDRLDTA